ncbi:hypothetical protein [Streptomyces mirabilis]|uniref:hypothetical protein n=1 Tax=Streptomyces mirabilis TaxID=68239 RepID=UPI00369065E6
MRIPFVTDARGDTYDRHAIDVKPTPPYLPPLTCKGCGIRVSARHGNADDPDSRSSHFFKLEPHTPTCRYDLGQRGKHLIDASGGTVVRLEGQWRLKCPPIERPATGGGARKPPGPARPGARGGGGAPRPTSKEAGQAIASAHRIVRLLDDFENDPETVAEFAATAPNGQRNIPWHEFCYGRADAHQLAQALIDGKASALAIPHAVWGPASTAGAVGRNHDTYVVMYFAHQPVTLDDGTRVKLRVTVRSNNPHWIGATTQSGQFLGYGYWQLFPKEDQAQARKRGWIELQLWVKEAWQVERWDTDGTTIEVPAPVRHAVPPRSPAPAPRPADLSPQEQPDVTAVPSDGAAAAPPPSETPVTGAPESSEVSASEDRTPETPTPPTPSSPEPEELQDSAASAAMQETPSVPHAEVPSPEPHVPTPASGESPMGQRPEPSIPPPPPYPPSTASPEPEGSMLQRWLRRRRRS